MCLFFSIPFKTSFHQLLTAKTMGYLYYQPSKRSGPQLTPHYDTTASVVMSFIHSCINNHHQAIPHRGKFSKVTKGFNQYSVYLHVWLEQKNIDICNHVILYFFQSILLIYFLKKKRKKNCTLTLKHNPPSVCSPESPHKANSE